MDWLLIGILLPIFLFGLVMSVVHGTRSEVFGREGTVDGEGNVPWQPVDA